LQLGPPHHRAVRRRRDQGRRARGHRAGRTRAAHLLRTGRRLMAVQRIEYRGVAAGYGQTRAVSGVSFAVNKGERWGLLGRNGAGKTTTLAAAVGLSDLQDGDILLDGQSMRGMPSFKRARAGLGYVPQGRDIFASLTVEENIVSAIRGGSTADALEIVYTLFPR